jgi:hypothetical protein
MIFIYLFIIIVTRQLLANHGAKGLTTRQKKRGSGPFPQRMGDKGGGKISENATGEHSSRGPKSHMMGAKVRTSVNFLSFPKVGSW